MASDFLMDIESPSISDHDMTRDMIAEASIWYTRTPSEVREDGEEFSVQALGMSAHLASQYAEEQAAAAQRTFLDHVGMLAGIKLAEDLLSIPTNDSQTAAPVETEPLDTVNAPADTGPGEIDHSTPSEGASLGEGTAPEGDHSQHVDPVPQSASVNDAGPGTQGLESHQDETQALPGGQGAAGSKRRAALERIAKSEKCQACGEAIHKDNSGKWTHSEYLYQKGHQRTHIPTPASKSKAASVVHAAADGEKTRYTVKMDHKPSGMKHEEVISAAGPEHAIADVRKRFPEQAGTEKAIWSAVPVMQVGGSRTAAAPTEDGLNFGVDFEPNPDPATSLSLGDEEGDWPDEGSGNSQTIENPTVAAAQCPDCGGSGKKTAAVLYDHTDDKPLRQATREQELAFQASRTGWIYVDANLIPIPAEISREAYVAQPVRKAYVGIETTGSVSREAYSPSINSDGLESKMAGHVVKYTDTRDGKERTLTHPTTNKPWKKRETAEQAAENIRHHDFTDSVRVEEA
jgi:hypothetical protein